MFRRLIVQRQPWHRQSIHGTSRLNLLQKSSTTFTLHTRYLSNESLKETLKKVKQDKEEREAESATAAGQDPTSSSSAKDKEEETTKAGPDVTEVLNKVIEFARNARQVIDENLRIAWGEMTGSTKESVLERKFEQAESFRRGKKEGDEDNPDDADHAETRSGPSDLVIVPVAKSYWQQMASRLDAPFIRNILKGAGAIGKQAADTPVGQQAKKIGENLQDKLNDAREIWETSQNPVITVVAGVWENLTGETEEGVTIAEIRKKDPLFVKEEWAAEVKKTLAPVVIKAHLEGNTKLLKPWLTEAVYRKLAAEILQRKQDGIEVDANILELDENQIILRFLEDGGPVIVVVYMVQQINCIRKKGEIVEGGETDIRAKFYSMAFQQVYEETNDEVSTLKWKVVDYALAGDIAYY